LVFFWRIFYGVVLEMMLHVIGDVAVQDVLSDVVLYGGDVLVYEELPSRLSGGSPHAGKS
jgi:hypothetical protein